MADKRISQLEEKTTLLADDEFPFIRNESGTYINYKVKRNNISTIIPDATPSITGGIRLTGDLGGTSLSPTVPELNLKANLASPNFTGTPTAPTPASNDNSTKLATTAFVTAAINNIAGTGDASPTLKGVIRLTGDLGGTADLPTVPGLTLKANITDLATVATSGSYSDLINLPILSTVAGTGSYTDLLNLPTIPTLTSQLTNDSGYLISNAVESVAGKTGIVVLDKTDVGLSNVDNTSDLDKPLSTATKDYIDLTLRTITANDLQLVTDKVIFINSISNVTFTLLAASSWVNTIIRIKSINVGLVNVIPDGIETIDGNTSISLTQYDSVSLFSNGTNIFII